MFTAALFTTDKTWKQPNCPSIDKWIKKSEYYSAMNKNEIMPFSVTWMDLKITMLSELNRQIKTNILYYLYVESKIGYK